MSVGQSETSRNEELVSHCNDKVCCLLLTFSVTKELISCAVGEVQARQTSLFFLCRVYRRVL